MNAVDTHVLSTLETLGGQEFVDEMLATALGSMRDHVAEIDRSAGIGDAEGIARAAHGLKSTAGAIGATRLLRAATAIEAAAVRGHVDPGDDAIAGLGEELRTFEAAVAALRREGVS
jgi:HPt (histidine-containing phosphotransfer) domain-containing protein